MTRKYHNHTPQTNRWHREEDPKTLKSQDIRKTIELKQPALPSPPRRLQHKKGH